MIQIRLLRDEDEHEWLRLRSALWPQDPPSALQAEMAALRADLERQPVFVAERPEGGLCGFLEVALHKTAPGCATEDIGYLEGWFIDPAWRGQGIGRRLVEAAEAWARSRGCIEMASDTTADYPVSPIAHARLGYQTTSQGPGGELYFRKELTS